ncbi:MAG: hypothetical protein RR101_05470 [Burkholderiaceae bacterium]
MTTLIAADIFGATPELQGFAIALDGDVLVTAASDHPLPPGQSEAQAYAAFIAAGGVAAYVARLRKRLEDPGLAIDRVIGFSAGATALWTLLATPAAAHWRSATLFYGSRIRDAADLEPRCPVKLIFAEQESAFDPAALVAALKARGLDAAIEPGSRHGFMNERSSGFDPALYRRHLAALRLDAGSTSRPSDRRREPR